MGFAAAASSAAFWLAAAAALLLRVQSLQAKASEVSEGCRASDSIQFSQRELVRKFGFFTSHVFYVFSRLLHVFCTSLKPFLKLLSSVECLASSQQAPPLGVSTPVLPLSTLYINARIHTLSSLEGCLGAKKAKNTSLSRVTFTSRLLSVIGSQVEGQCLGRSL